MIFFPKYILLSNLSFTYLIIKLNVCPKIYSLIKTEIFVCFFFFSYYFTLTREVRWGRGGNLMGQGDKETEQGDRKRGGES